MRLLCFGSSVGWRKRNCQDMTREIGIGADIDFTEDIESYQSCTSQFTC